MLTPGPKTETFDDGHASDSSAVARVCPYLFVILECDRPSAGGARYALTGIDEVVIGRGSERSATHDLKAGVSRLCLSVPGRSMSSTHARLVRSEGDWVLCDARSTNGSSVNGKQVETCRLREGDIIELGHTILTIQNALPTPPGTPPNLDFAEAAAAVEMGLFTLIPLLAADLAKLTRVAPSGLAVLLLGDTGTGKEVLARAIHRMSNRPGPFAPVNCGAIPPNLVESHLFGHTKGAFTGATRSELGLVRAATGGTLFLDEVGDLPMVAQPTLLRVLQEQEVTPVGSTRAMTVDIRVVAATHQPLERLIEADRFRRDLFARLDAFRLQLPELNRRIVDLGCIVAQAMAKEAPWQLTPEAGVALAMHDWPSNIRQLVTALRRGAVLSENGCIALHHLGLDSPSRQPPPARPDARPERKRQTNDVELRDELVLRLTESQGNIAEVARAMGKARMQVHRWLKRFGIELAPFRAESKAAPSPTARA